VFHKKRGSPFLIITLEKLVWFLANVNSRSRSLYAIARPSVCSLSVVCNVRAPYSGGSNFREYFYGIRYISHPLTFTENFTEIVPGEPPPPPAPGELNTRGVAKYSDFGPIDGYISETVQDRCKLVLITNRKSYMGFRLVPKSVTLNALERRNGRYFALFQRIRVASGRTA